MSDAYDCLNNNLDATKSATDFFLYFIKFDRKENYNSYTQPGIISYPETYSCVHSSKMNPLIHYIKYVKIKIIMFSSSIKIDRSITERRILEQ